MMQSGEDIETKILDEHKVEGRWSVAGVHLEQNYLANIIKMQGIHNIGEFQRYKIRIKIWLMINPMAK